MISASAFCKLHSSFWRDVAPTTDIFVRRLNLRKEREFPEMDIPTRPMRRGFINEVAFAVFCQSAKVQRGWPPEKLRKEEIDAAVASVVSLAAHREVRAGDKSEESLAADELLDIEEQCNRLLRMFSFNRPADALVTEPIFPGCGIVDTCKGDVIVSNTLFEVKAGDRKFLSVDIRQLITYATLNQISKRFRIDGIGLFNPRVGTSVTISVDDLCFEVSGKRSDELFSQIASVISSGEISR